MIKYLTTRKQVWGTMVLGRKTTLKNPNTLSERGKRFMEHTTVKYYGKDYGVTLDGGHWFLDCSYGEKSGTLPIKKAEINKAIRTWKNQEREMEMESPRCKVCNKLPNEISEYQNQGVHPIQFVKENERLTPDGNFYCTSCYIKAGMPLW